MEEWDKPELIDVSDRRIPPALAPASENRRIKSVLGLVLFCAVAFVGLRMLSGSAEAEPTPDVEDDIAAEISDESTPSTTEDQPDTTSVHSNPRVLSLDARSVDEGESFYGFATGWDLFLGGFDEKMISIPLDGGEQTAYETVVPVLVVGDWLLTGGRRNIGQLDLSDPEATVEPFGPATLFGLTEIASRAAADENQVWLLGGDFFDLKWQLWEVGEVSEQITEVDAPGNIYFGLPVHPELISATSGGVFETLQGEPAKRVADGRLLDVTDSHAIVQQCENPYECEVLWLNRSDWEVDPNVISPADINELAWPVISVTPDARRALVSDAQGGSSTLWNLTTGEAEQSNLQAAALSPDGRFLASIQVNGSLAIVDLDTGEVAQAGRQRFYRYSQMVFVRSR